MQENGKAQFSNQKTYLLPPSFSERKVSYCPFTIMPFPFSRLFFKKKPQKFFALTRDESP